MERIEQVTFVCQANINRSPAAQCIAKYMAQARGLSVEFRSAGLMNPSYRALSSEMAWALRELGYQPPKQHIPTRATPEFLQRSNLVLCFERGQVEQIRALRREIGDNVYTLPDYAGFPEEEIPDLDRLIQATSLSYVINRLPGLLKRPLYDRIGHVHPADDMGVLEVHRRLVMAIESCVEKTIERIAETYLG